MHTKTVRVANAIQELTSLGVGADSLPGALFARGFKGRGGKPYSRYNLRRLRYIAQHGVAPEKRRSLVKVVEERVNLPKHMQALKLIRGVLVDAKSPEERLTMIREVLNILE